jgi:hypothetical protein
MRLWLRAIPIATMASGGRNRCKLVLLVLLALLPAVSTIHPFRFNFNFGRPLPQNAPGPPSPEASNNVITGHDPAAGAGAGTGAPELNPGLDGHATVMLPIPGGVAPMGNMQQVNIPIQIPATPNSPAHTVNLVLQAPAGVQVRHGVAQVGAPQLAVHAHEHPDQHHSHQHNPTVGIAVPHGHGHEHHTPHQHAPGCRHHQPTPGQLAVQHMLQIASQQCNQVQCNNAGAPFHWPDRVLVCAHEPGQ